jgi:hypothetical protein
MWPFVGTQQQHGVNNLGCTLYCTAAQCSALLMLDMQHLQQVQISVRNRHMQRHAKLTIVAGRMPSM